MENFLGHSKLPPRTSSSDYRRGLRSLDRSPTFSKLRYIYGRLQDQSPHEIWLSVRPSGWNHFR